MEELQVDALKVGEVYEIEAGMTVGHLMVEGKDKEIRNLPVYDARKVDRDAVYLVIRLTTGAIWAYNRYLIVLGHVVVGSGEGEALLWNILKTHQGNVFTWENYEMPSGASGTAIMLDMNRINQEGGTGCVQS